MLLSRRARRRARHIVLTPLVAVPDGVLDSTLDAARCSNPGCGALLPLTDRPARCPRCGRA